VECSAKFRGKGRHTQIHLNHSQSCSYSFHLVCDAESSDCFYSSPHTSPLFHSSASPCSTLCCCQSERHVRIKLCIKSSDQCLQIDIWLGVFVQTLTQRVIKQFTGYILAQGNHCKAALHDYAVDTQKTTKTKGIRTYRGSNTFLTLQSHKFTIKLGSMLLIIAMSEINRG